MQPAPYLKIILLILFLGTQQAYSQRNPYDSLENILAKTPSDTQKLAVLKQLSDLAFGSDMEKALVYSRQGVLLAEKTGNKEKQPQFYEMEGRMHANLLHLDSASYFFDKATAGYTALGNKRGQATTLFKIAWVATKRGEPDKALAANLKASALMEELGDKRGMAGAYERIADNLSGQGELDRAMDYAQKAIDICEANHIDDEMVYALSTAGNVKIAGSKFQESFNYFDRALELAKSLKFSEISLADFMNNRGNALKKLGRYNEALTEYKNCLSIAQKTNYPNAIAASIANLGEVNLLLGNYKEALPYQLLTVKMQEENNDLSNLTENYLHVSNIYEHLGDYKSALAFQKKALMIRDSIASLRNNENMSELLTQYETKKKEATILSQQKEIAQQEKMQWMGGGILVLLAGLFIFGIIAYRVRVKRNKILAAKNAENELLLKEIHHRVKNNLEVVSSLLALQSAQTKDPNTRNAMRESQNRVRSIGIVHQQLYNGKNSGAIRVKDYFLNLSESILDSFGAGERVKVELDIQEIKLDIDTAVPLGLIVNELVTNTLKYAFPPGQIGHLSIRLQKREENLVRLEVADDGIGKSGNTLGTGFGSQLISLLTRQLGGKLLEETGYGTRTILDFKVASTS